MKEKAEALFDKGIIQPDSKQIESLTSAMWKVPQYVILYYCDRTEIYRCELEEQ